MWANGNIVYVAVKATHNLAEMTLNGENHLSCDKFSAHAPITVDGKTYDPQEGLQGNTKDAHWTVFQFNLESLGLSEAGKYPFYIKGIGGGHDVGGNFSVVIPTTDVEGEKRWNGGVERPEITLQLLRHVSNETPELVDSHAVNGSEQPEWKYTWENEPKYDPYGRQYIYTIDEQDVPPNYKKSLNQLTVTNTYDPEGHPEPTLLNITVTKEWVGPATESATFKLFADEVDTMRTLVLHENNNWVDSFSNLNKYHADTAEEIIYTVKEVPIEGYSTTVTGSVDEGFTFTNTLNELVVDKVNIHVKKIWEGPELDSVTIKLFANNEDTGKRIVLRDSHDDESWIGSFNGYAKFDSLGNEIQYSVKEINVPEAYDVTYSIGNDGEHIVTNTISTMDEGIVTVKHVDEAGIEIADSDIYTDAIGEPYVTAPKDIPGYIFVKIDENGALTTGIFEAEEQTVIYVYKKKLGSLTITKVNENNKPLKGAKFELRDSNDIVIDTRTTKDDGIIVFERLAIGTYTLVETRAPEGYRKLVKSIPIEIKIDNLDIQKNIKNTKQNWKIPKTGGIGTAGFYGVGFILMAASGWVVLRRRKE